MTNYIKSKFGQLESGGDAKLENIIYNLVNPIIVNPLSCRTIPDRLWSNFIRTYIKGNETFYNKVYDIARDDVQNKIQQYKHRQVFDARNDIITKTLHKRRSDFEEAVFQISGVPLGEMPEEDVLSLSNVTGSFINWLSTTTMPLISSATKTLGLSKGKRKSKTRKRNRKPIRKQK